MFLVNTKMKKVTYLGEIHWVINVVCILGPPNIRYLQPIHVKTDTDVTLHCPYSGYPIK